MLFKDNNEHQDTCRCHWHDAILILSPTGLLCLMVFRPQLAGKFISVYALVFLCLFGHFSAQSVHSRALLRGSVWQCLSSCLHDGWRLPTWHGLALRLTSQQVRLHGQLHATKLAITSTVRWDQTIAFGTALFTERIWSQPYHCGLMLNLTYQSCTNILVCIKMAAVTFCHCLFFCTELVLSSSDLM